MDIHPVLSRVRQLELARVMGNHSVSWVWVGLHWSAPFHWKPWDTRQEGIGKKEGVNWHYGGGYFLALPSGSFIHLKVQLFLTQPFNWMLSLATFFSWRLCCTVRMYNESFCGCCSGSGQEPMPWPSHLQEGLEWARKRQRATANWNCDVLLSSLL